MQNYIVQLRQSLLLTSALFILSASIFQSCHAQTKPSSKATESAKKVGGHCDGCNLMYIDMPQKIDNTDTSIAWSEPAAKLLVEGTVYKNDGKTPADNIVLYYYHTDHEGNYSKRNDKPGNQTAHGHIRGWVKTGNDGRYAIYTGRPASYPGTTAPQHIHVIVKEPGLNEYYIDELLFNDDPNLTQDRRKDLKKRGGSQVLFPIVKKDMQVAKYDIILGSNIEDYPK